MSNKTFAVTGATGHIGKVVVAWLEGRGHKVRAISRSAGVDLDNGPALRRAFAGADGAFLLIPPDLQAEDVRRRQNEIGSILAQAVKEAAIRRVVFLSSVFAQYAEGTGVILGLHDMEERLNPLGIPELVYLHPGFFMENHLWGLEMIAEMGVYGTALRPDLPMPMIATRDIGEKAAELLTEEPFRQPRVRELLGPRDYTMTEATRILGEAIDRPDLKYVQFPYDQARNALLSKGLSASYADGMIEMIRCGNEGTAPATENRSADSTTATTLEQFAQEVFREAYEALTAVAH